MNMERWIPKNEILLDSMDDMVINCLKSCLDYPHGILCVLTAGLKDFQTFEYWDPVFVHSHTSTTPASEAIQRLTQNNRIDYVGPGEVIPGVGLLGALWAKLPWDGISTGISLSETSHSPRYPIVWKDIKSLVDDPDQPYNLRLQLIYSSGIGTVAAVPYNFKGTRGIVVFGARSTVDTLRLKSDSNQNMLINSANVIGSIVALDENFKNFRETKSLRTSGHLKRVTSLKCFEESFNNSESYIIREKESDSWIPSICYNNRLWLSLQKCFRYTRKIQAPVPLTLKQSVFSFFGVFVSVSLWGLINQIFIRISNGDHRLTRGSYGSLLATIYLQSAAPAAQPYNALFSQMICGFTAITINTLVSYIPHFPNYFTDALSMSIVVAIMGKLGCIHPTAAGDALLYGKHKTVWNREGFILFFCILFNYVFGIVLGTLINNLSPDRQYPNYWRPSVFLCKIVESESMQRRTSFRERIVESESMQNQTSFREGRNPGWKRLFNSESMQRQTSFRERMISREGRNPRWKRPFNSVVQSNVKMSSSSIVKQKRGFSSFSSFSSVS